MILPKVTSKLHEMLRTLTEELKRHKQTVCIDALLTPEILRQTACFIW